VSKTNVWMPLYIGDYLADTSHLTIEQSGAYLHLLMSHWRVGYVPDDDAKMAAICRVPTRRWKAHFAPAIRPFFQAEDGKLTHKRVLAELKKVAKVRQIRQANSRQRWSKSKDQESNDSNDMSDAKASVLHGVSDAFCMTQSQVQKKKERKKVPEATLLASDDAPEEIPEPELPGLPAVVPSAVKPPDVRAELWQHGLPILRGLTGKPEAPMRSLLGKLLKAGRDDCELVLRVLRDAMDLRPADPVAWLMQAVGNDRDSDAAILRAAGLRPDGTLIDDRIIDHETERKGWLQ
jgi:uncharacterized protein YdaU (DUF1376 family)